MQKRNNESAAEMIVRLFPFKQEEDLKVYSVLSARADIAPLITDNSAKMMLVAAYSLDEALRQNDMYLTGMIPTTVHNWRPGILVTQMAYQQIVPVEKITQMVHRIRDEFVPSPESKREANVEEIQNYVKYVCDVAGSSPYEKGIMTGILNRFKSKVMNGAVPGQK